MYKHELNKTAIRTPFDRKNNPSSKKKKRLVSKIERRLSKDKTANNTTLNYIDKIQNNLKLIYDKNLHSKDFLSETPNKSNLSFSPVNSKGKTNDVFITFKIENARKINKIIENNLCTFSDNINNNYIAHEDKVSNTNSKRFFNNKTKSYHNLEKLKDSDLIISNIVNSKCNDKPNRKIDYIHYTDTMAKSHEYRSHNINFQDYGNLANNLSHDNNNISNNEFLKQNFLEKRNQTIKERISRSLSNSRGDEKSKNLFKTYFSIPKNDSLKDSKNFYYESDRECSNFKYTLGELNKEKNNNLICKLRNINHNHNQSSSKYSFRRAAYEKRVKNISFLTFKMNHEKSNEIKSLNFMNSQNRIRYIQNYLQSPNISGVYSERNLSRNKNINPEADNYCQDAVNQEEKSQDSPNDRIICKMINDSEIIIKWLKSLKIKDAEKLQFFDDANRDNTKYLKNANKESVMSEIKKG